MTDCPKQPSTQKTSPPEPGGILVGWILLVLLAALVVWGTVQDLRHGQAGRIWISAAYAFMILCWAIRLGRGHGILRKPMTRWDRIVLFGVAPVAVAGLATWMWIVSRHGVDTHGNLEAAADLPGISLYLPAGADQKWAEVPDLPALPGDTFETSTKIGRYNASLESRRMARARESLEHFDRRLHMKTPEELMEMLCCGWDYKGVAYYVARDGNVSILDELKSRGESARKALQAHGNDTRSIFTGSSGVGTTIGGVCRTFLEGLNAQSARPASATAPPRP